MTNPTITRLLMRICASRLDPAVSAGSFVELIEELIDEAMAPVIVEETPELRAVTNGEDFTRKEHYPPAPKRVPPPPPRPRTLIIPPTFTVEAEEPDQDEKPVEPPPRRRRKSRPHQLKISYDNRVRIRMQADKALEENGGRMPRGFVSNLAGEWNVSDQTIYNILRGEQ